MTTDNRNTGEFFYNGEPRKDRAPGNTTDPGKNPTPSKPLIPLAPRTPVYVKGPPEPPPPRKNRFYIGPAVADEPTITPVQLNKVATTPRSAQLNVSSTDERARIILGRYRVGAVIPWSTYYGEELVVVCV